MGSVAFNDRRWAVLVEERAQAGIPVPYISIQLASSVLGRPILRGGPHSVRPDTKDLQAGDTHDELVPL